MDRRQFTADTASITLGALILMAHQQARALSIHDLSNAEASQGLKAALEKGADAAVSLLGRADGFLGNPKVRIPLPGFLEQAAGLLMTGGDTSVTRFFADKTREPLGVRFLPIVTKATEKVGLAEKYNNVAGKAAGMGLLDKKDANIQQYVTGKSLDGLYLVIGEEERRLRQDPVGSGSAILSRVFGVLK